MIFLDFSIFSRKWSMFKSFGMAKSWLDYLICSPGDGRWEWLDSDSHSKAWKESKNSFFFENSCCCIQNIMILNFIIGCHKWHLSWLSNEMRILGYFWFKLLWCFTDSFAKCSFIAWPVQTSLCIKSCLDDIKRICWNWCQSSCNTTTKIIFPMIISLLYIKDLFQRLIHENDHWSKWNVHEIIDEKASIKWDNSLIFIHGFY